MAMGSPLNSFSMVSFASPYSGLEAENFDAFFRNGQLHGVGALIGKLRDAPHRIAQFRPLDDHALVVVPREYRFVVRELAGENARNSAADGRPGKRGGFRLLQIRCARRSRRRWESFSTSSMAFFGMSTFTSPFSPASL